MSTDHMSEILFDTSQIGRGLLNLVESQDAVFYNGLHRSTDQQKVAALLTQLAHKMRHYSDFSYEEKNAAFWLDIAVGFKTLEAAKTNAPFPYDSRAISFPYWDGDWPVAISGNNYAAFGLPVIGTKIRKLLRPKDEHNKDNLPPRAFMMRPEPELVMGQISAIQEVFRLWPPLYMYDFIEDPLREKRPKDVAIRDAWDKDNADYLNQPWRYYSHTMVFGPELVARYNLKNLPWEDAKVCYYKWIGDDILWVASDFGFKSDFGKHSYMNQERAKRMYLDRSSTTQNNITAEEGHIYLEMHEQALKEILPFDLIVRDWNDEEASW